MARRRAKTVKACGKGYSGNMRSKPRQRDLYAFSYAEGWRTLKALWPWRFLFLFTVLMAVVLVSAALDLWWVATFIAPALVMVLTPVLTPKRVREARLDRAREFRRRHYCK
jgi:hypothetical protein